MNIQSFPITPTAIEAMIVPLPPAFTRTYGDLYQMFRTAHPKHSNPTTVIFDYDRDTMTFWLYDLIDNFAIDCNGKIVQLPVENCTVAVVKQAFIKMVQATATPA